jgi:hypothetical protein
MAFFGQSHLSQQLLQTIFEIHNGEIICSLKKVETISSAGATTGARSHFTTHFVMNHQCRKPSSQPAIADDISRICSRVCVRLPASQILRHLVIDYVPRAKLIESKSLKLYLGAFRNHNAFHEDCTVSIAKRLIGALKPRWLRSVAIGSPVVVCQLMCSVSRAYRQGACG